MKWETERTSTTAANVSATGHTKRKLSDGAISATLLSFEPSIA